MQPVAGRGPRGLHVQPVRDGSERVQRRPRVQVHRDWRPRVTRLACAHIARGGRVGSEHRKNNAGPRKTVYREDALSHTQLGPRD